MSAFNFRLAKVLSVREIQEEQAKQSWAIAERLAHEERVKLRDLLGRREEVKEFGYQQADLNLLQAMYKYLAVLDEQIEHQSDVVELKEQRAQVAKDAWLHTRQETKKVSTLREKQYQEFVKEELRKEQKILDDMRSNLG